MKTITLFSLTLLALTSLKALAQTDDKTTQPVKTGNEWQMPKDVLQRAKAFSDGLQKSLSLSDSATKKVFNAYLGNTKSVDEIHMGKGSESEKKAALTTNQQAFDQVLKEILTPAQFETYIKKKKAKTNT
jgi:hypothetical protein